MRTKIPENSLRDYGCCHFAVGCAVSPGNPLVSPIIELDAGWEYRIGDSPVDSMDQSDQGGRFVWLDDSLGSAGWTPLGGLDELLNLSGQRSLWVRIRLPALEGTCPAVHVSSFRQISQVWLDDKRLYEFGNFASNRVISVASSRSEYASVVYASSEGDHFRGWRSHLIGLPPTIRAGF